jgi:hypothetical protein
LSGSSSTCVAMPSPFKQSPGGPPSEVVRLAVVVRQK